VALLAIAAAAGAERGSSAAVPKRVLKQIEQAKLATARFKDVATAEADGYSLWVSAWPSGPVPWASIT
jgi:hypothetical protein